MNEWRVEHTPSNCARAVQQKHDNAGDSASQRTRSDRYRKGVRKQSDERARNPTYVQMKT